MFSVIVMPRFLRTERFPKFAGAVVNNLFVFVSHRVAFGHSHRVTFGHSMRVTFGNIKLHLPICFPKGKTVKIFLQNKTVLQRMNVPLQDTIVCEQANRRLDI